MKSDALQNLLDRLDKLKQTAPSQWVACCPAHDSKSQKLSICETNDGRILLKCWSGGCTASEIVSAVGLSMADLFPEHMRYKNQRSLPKGQRFLPRTVLNALYEELVIVYLVSRDLLKGKPIDQQRLSQATTRLLNAIEEVTYD